MAAGTRPHTRAKETGQVRHAKNEKETAHVRRHMALNFPNFRAVNEINRTTTTYTFAAVTQVVLRRLELFNQTREV